MLKETLIVSARQRNIVTGQTVAGDHTAWKEISFLMKGRLDFNKIVILTDHSKKLRHVDCMSAHIFGYKIQQFYGGKGIF
ncbi:MAG: hypothetical protein WBB70_01645 [Desulfobacterales bacterium]